MNLKKVAQAALDEVMAEDAFMTLEEHDRRYHDGHYVEGDECLFRERLESGDDSDAALNDANEKEAASYYAKAHEKERIVEMMKGIVPFMASASRRKKYGATMSVGNQKKNGDIDITIETFPVVPDSAVDEKHVKHLLEDNLARVDPEGNRVRTSTEYKLKGIKRESVRGDGLRNGGKKVFTITINNPNLIGRIAKPKSDLTVQVAPYRELSEVEKSRALKKYGLKMENGKVSRRNGVDDKTPEERYRDMVEADWRSGRRALKNMTNAEIKQERDAREKDELEERMAFLESLGILN